MLTPEQKVAIKSLEVNYKNAEENQDEQIWLLPIHAQRILELLEELTEGDSLGCKHCDGTGVVWTKKVGAPTNTHHKSSCHFCNGTGIS